jgi:hypothetical protein
MFDGLITPHTKQTIQKPQQQNRKFQKKIKCVELVFACTSHNGGKHDNNHVEVVILQYSTTV